MMLLFVADCNEMENLLNPTADLAKSMIRKFNLIR